MTHKYVRVQLLQTGIHFTEKTTTACLQNVLTPFLLCTHSATPAQYGYMSAASRQHQFQGILKVAVNV